MEDEREEADVGGHAVLERAPVEHDAGGRARVVPCALHARQRRHALLEARVTHADAARLDQLRAGKKCSCDSLLPELSTQAFV